MTREKCWFCKSTEGVRHCTSLKLKLSRNYQRREHIGATEVTWEERMIDVPRCERCKSVHNRKGYYLTIGALIGVLLGGLSAVALWTAALNPVGFGEIVAQFCGSIILLAIVGILIGWLRPLPKGVLPAKAASEHPVVAEFSDEGWDVHHQQDFFQP